MRYTPVTVKLEGPELRATTSIVRLLCDTNQREGCAMLAEIYNCFTEGFDTPTFTGGCVPLVACARPRLSIV